MRKQAEAAKIVALPWYKRYSEDNIFNLMGIYLILSSVF
jgi:hypothetical protein